jgi:hypothetical protein
VLADGTKPGTDGSATTPSLEGPAPELLPFIGDDIPGRAASVTNRFAEKTAKPTAVREK